MFEVGWLELLVIAVVLIVVVGPKDLPGMLRTFGRVTNQLRRMAGDFRKQFDEALREAELEDVRKAASDLKKLDPRDDLRKAMNPMKSVGDEIRSSLKAATQAPAPKVPSADEGAHPMDDAGPAAGPVPAPPVAAAADVAAVTPLPEETAPAGAQTATDTISARPGDEKRNAGEVA